MLFLEKIILNHPQLIFKDKGVLQISYLGVRLKPMPPKQKGMCGKESLGYMTLKHTSELGFSVFPILTRLSFRTTMEIV